MDALLKGVIGGILCTVAFLTVAYLIIDWLVT